MIKVNRITNIDLSENAREFQGCFPLLHWRMKRKQHGALLNKALYEDLEYAWYE